MANTFLLSNLVLRCQQRCDKEGDASIDALEWKSLISETYAELHAVVVEPGSRYFETEATITADGSASYALPSDHLATVGVDFVIDSAGRRRELDELMVQERNDWGGQIGDAFAFALSGSTLVLYPKPTTGTYKHIYAPQPTDYSAAADATVVDLINVWGLKFLVWGVASIALHKGEASQIRALDERKRAEEQLQYWAANRALNNPKRRTRPRELYLGDDPSDFRTNPPR